MGAVNVYRTSVDGSGRVRFFLTGGELPDVVEYCARYFEDNGVAPSDPNISGGPAAEKAEVKASSEASTEPDVFAAIENSNP